MKGYPKHILLLSLLTIMFSLLIINCGRDNKEKAGQSIPVPDEIKAEYLGRESCAKCHEEQYELFQQSDHDLAMDHATEETVLGNFNNSEFLHFGVKSKFYKKQDKYYVFTEGTGGEMKEFEIAFTFGVRPLQQYIIEFPNGAYQCLPIAWDTRAVEEGGQKWFHIYNEEEISSDDILFWTRPTMNWNYMCSECHSTNVKKAYDYSTKSYNTSWSEIDVSCESCHGPGSEHILWAKQAEEGSNISEYENMGLVVSLKDTDNGRWIFDPDSTTARRSVPRKSEKVVQMCARCHSRRSVIKEDYYHGGSLLQTHWPSLMEEDLYFADGQILDEVYVYGSFLQSKMYQSGVVCKDCHDPHSGKILVEGNGLCYRCHMADKYGSREHHFHDPNGKGSSCFECHMHERNYMLIDPRRDHSIRIPRPDLSQKLGTPNACNQCHTNKSIEWAANYLEDWYGKELLNKKHYGEIFWAGRQGFPDAFPELFSLIENNKNAPMIRASAISLLNNYADSKILDLLQKTIKDKDPLIRYATLTNYQFTNSPSTSAFVIAGLSDSIRLVRLMAANALSGTDRTNLPPDKIKLWEKAMAEYKSSLMINADHPSTHINFGNLYLNLGDLAAAESSYHEALSMEPGLVAPYINLAELYRRQGRDDEGEEILKNALLKYPELASINYSLGLLNIRKGDQNKGLEYLKKAAILAPEEARYSYVYGIGLNSIKETDNALKILEEALRIHPYNRDILYALTSINLEKGNQVEARIYAQKLFEYFPSDPEIRNLINSMNN